MSHPNRGPFRATDLPMFDGIAYHLGVPAHAIAKDILIVGDPDRAKAIADEHLESLEAQGEHRGLVTRTGIARSTGRRLTITTSGMGTGSAEIVLNELVALHELDPNTGIRRAQVEPLTIIRVGTSGALHRETALGSAVISSAAVGLDSTGWFYDTPLTAEERKLADLARARMEEGLLQGHPGQGLVRPYAAIASPEVVSALRDSAVKCGMSAEVGVTVTAAGFFAGQGRDVSRVPPLFRDLDRLLAREPRFRNFEMEASILLRLCRALGYRAGAICVAAANREQGTFCPDIATAMDGVVRAAIQAFASVER